MVIDTINFNSTFQIIVKGAATHFFTGLSSGMADNKRKCIWQSSFETFDLKSLASEATPSATQFSKGLTKLAIILDYKRPWMLCLAFQPGQKLGMILSFEVVLKSKLPTNHSNKKYAPKTLFLTEKKIRKM